jgi:hypothetical protein
MTAGGVIYIPSFIKIGSGIQKLTREFIDILTDIHTAWRLHNIAFIFSKYGK